MERGTMTTSKPHSMLEGDFAMVRAAVEGWDHDEPHYTEVIAGYPLCDRCATEAALRRIEEQLEALRRVETTLRDGWPKSVLVDRDGANEEMLAFPLSAWWPVRDALAALDSNPAYSPDGSR